MNRREFLKRTGTAVVGAAALRAGAARAADAPPARRYVLVSDPADAVASAPAARWAIEQLRAALAERGADVQLARSTADAPADAACIVAAGAGSAVARDLFRARDLKGPEGAESLAIVSGEVGGRHVLLAGGQDVRGLVYAVTEIADIVRTTPKNADALGGVAAAPVIERPANRVRSAMRMISSDVEDRSWFHDRAFWERYLSMLVSQRFNRVNLSFGLGYDFPHDIKDAYFYFAYPFLLSVPGYQAKVRELPDAERDKNLEMLRFASDEAVKRGLEFQLGIWTHAFEWPNSPGVNYTVEGVNKDNQGNYCRDAVRLVLKECPNVTGVTFRIHGESGVAEGSYEFWKAVFQGVATCGRRVGIDMHAKGMDQPMIDLALATGLPITISPKYWAEHMGLPYHQAWIRPTEMPRPPRGNEGGGGAGQQGGFFSRSSGSRSFLRYGYGDLMREDRKYDVLFRMWPGTQRFLSWGDPAFASAYGRASSFCGAAGMEWMEALSFKGRKGSGLKGPRDAYAGPEEGHDFEPHAYAYRLWGRLTYNPEAHADVWQRKLCADFPADGAATKAEAALGAASRVLPLITTAHLPSAANNNYWPEVYTNMSIVDANRPSPYSDTPSPRRFGTVSPLDPQLFSRVDDSADELLKGGPVAKYSPAEVSAWLLALADQAARRPAGAGDAAPPAQRRVLGDVQILEGVARFFAHKLRAGVLYALFDRTHDASALTEALAAYRAARDAWAALADGPGASYVADITFGLERQLRGHWKDRIAAIDQDIADMAARQSAADNGAAGKAAAAIAAVLKPAPRPRLRLGHDPAESFTPGKDLAVELLAGSNEQVSAARLFYRHVDQSKPWQDRAMEAGDGHHFKAVIPADYTNSPFPLQYYFQVRPAGARACCLYPGLGDDLTGPPYVVVRRA